MRCCTCGENLELCNFKLKRNGSYTQNCKSCLLKSHQSAYNSTRLKLMKELDIRSVLKNERVHANYKNRFLQPSYDTIPLSPKDVDDGEEEYVFQPLK